MEQEISPNMQQHFHNKIKKTRNYRYLLATLQKNKPKVAYNQRTYVTSRAAAVVTCGGRGLTIRIESYCNLPLCCEPITTRGGIPAANQDARTHTERDPPNLDTEVKVAVVLCDFIEVVYRQ